MGKFPFIGRELKPVRVQTIGGLGNQLFCYSFGRYLSLKHGIRVVFDLSEVDRGLTKHGVSIDSFVLDGEFVNFREQDSPFSYLTRRLLYGLQTRWGFFNSLPLIPKSYTADLVGYDSKNELAAKPGLTMRGYFASHLYWEWLNQHGYGFELKLRKQGPYFDSLSKRVEGIRFAVVHVRRGDYVKQADEYGLCGPDYFAESLLQLRERGVVWDQTLVFSDDVGAAKELLSDIPEDFKLEFVNPPTGTDASESMEFMARGVAHVISNSSFSLWSAMLSKSSEAVIAPTPWHKGMAEPEDLLPKGWIRVPADFL